MNPEAYVYQAALLCEDCGASVRAALAAEGKAPADPDDESTYDSGDYPKGPYADGGGEADSPQHCDACHAFLENPLTDDGVRFVLSAIEADYIEKGDLSACAAQWRAHYGIEPASPRAIRFARLSPALLAMADDKTGELPAYAWPGGYPMFYGWDGDWVCVACANDPTTGVDAFGTKLTWGDVNWEDGECYCDCGERIESAYAEDGEAAEDAEVPSDP